MRVLLANKYFFVKGGAERALFDADAALRERGHEPIHFAMQDPRNAPSPWSDYFVTQASYEAPRVDLATLRSLARMFYSREVRARLEALIRDARPDVALLNNVYHQLGPSLVLALHAARVPMAMLLHDYKPVCPSYLRWRDGHECSLCAGGRFFEAARHGCGGSHARGAVLAAEAYWQWRVLHTYDLISRYAAPSRYLIATLHEMGFPYDVALLRNAVDQPVDAVDPGVGRALGYAGRLTREKGLDVLLEAAAGLPDVPLRIAGDGPERERLMREAARRELHHVTFLGHLAPDVVVREIATWRAAIVPSVWPENSPYAVLEPFGLGVPVIGSDLGGVRELLEGRGWLVPPGDAAALREAMLGLWQNLERARELGRLGRELASAECRRGPFGEAVESLLAGLLTGSGLP